MAKKHLGVDFNALAETQVAEQLANQEAEKAATKAREEFLAGAEAVLQGVVDKAAAQCGDIFPSGTIEMTIRPDTKATNYVYMSGLKVSGQIPGEGFTHPGKVVAQEDWTVARV